MDNREYCKSIVEEIEEYAAGKVSPIIVAWMGLKSRVLNTVSTIIFIVFPGRGMAVKLQNNITG